MRMTCKANLKDNRDLPRAFSSCVHPRRSSCTSSGATSVRCHASDQDGFAGVVSSTTGILVVFFAAPESLPRKTRVKKGIARRKKGVENRVGYFFAVGGRYQPERGTAGDPKCQRSGDGFDSEPCEDRRKSILFEDGRKYQSINYRRSVQPRTNKIPKETTPVSTRIARRREESLHQRPNEEGEKGQREDYRKGTGEQNQEPRRR